MYLGTPFPISVASCAVGSRSLLFIRNLHVPVNSTCSRRRSCGSWNCHAAGRVGGGEGRSAGRVVGGEGGVVGDEGCAAGRVVGDEGSAADRVVGGEGGAADRVVGGEGGAAEEGASASASAGCGGSMGDVFVEAAARRVSVLVVTTFCDACRLAPCASSASGHSTSECLRLRTCASGIVNRVSPSFGPESLVAALGFEAAALLCSYQRV